MDEMASEDEMESKHKIESQGGIEIRHETEDEIKDDNGEQPGACRALG